MKISGEKTADVSTRVHVLRHIETGEFVCLQQGGEEYLAAFRDGDSALQFREELQMIEFVDVERIQLADAPFERFWLDGERVVRPAPRERRRAA